MPNFEQSDSAPRCEHCGGLIQRRKRGRDARRYCGRPCAFAVQRQSRLARAERLSSDRAQRLALGALQRDLTVPVLRSYTCKQCGSAIHIPAEKGRWRQLCNTCRDDNHAASKRADHFARRTRERGASAIERLDPIAVLDACGWFCAACYTPTPKAKRGTTAPNAPELDHITPLSRGGAHVASNLQCLCRACNALKSNRPLTNAALLLLRCELSTPRYR